jgi:hypothetical protein
MYLTKASDLLGLCPTVIAALVSETLEMLNTMDKHRMLVEYLPCHNGGRLVNYLLK